MSVYAGLSLKDVYVSRCEHFRCRPNSAILKWLPEEPDMFHTVTQMDLSNNFLGPKGILPLLEVIRCCTHLRTVDLSEQQLNIDAVEMICTALRNHVSVRVVNLSNNPLNIAAGHMLLNLAKENTMIESITVDNTSIRNAMSDLLAVQLLKNHDMNHSPRHMSADKSSDNNTHAVKARGGESAAAAAAAVAAIVASKSTSGAIKNNSEASIVVVSTTSRLLPPLGRAALEESMDQFMRRFKTSVHPNLLDENPVPSLTEWLLANEPRNMRQYLDTQFASHGRDDCHRAARLKYGISTWHRVSESFPGSQLMPTDGIRLRSSSSPSGGQPNVQLPHKTRPGFSWILMSILAAASHLPGGLQDILLEPCRPSGSSLGFYVAKLFIDGAWRYVVVDDFLPVDKDGQLVFARPVIEGASDSQVYVWPCIVEKVFAKIYGGYEKIDFDPRDEFELEEVERNTYPFSVYGRTRPLPKEARIPPCARVMSDLTGGVQITKSLHDPFESESWWGTMVDLLSSPSTAQPGPTSTAAVAVSRPELEKGCGIESGRAYQVLQVRHVNGVRLLQLCNPWCKRKWDGEWSQQSTTWLMFPEIEDMLSTAEERQARSPTRDFYTSAMAAMKIEPFSSPFWIAYIDFLKYFEEMHLCRTFPECRERLMTGAWDKKTAGGCITEDTWYTNPHFQLKVMDRDAFFVNISMPDSRFTGKCPATMATEEFMAAHVIQAARYPLRDPDEVASVKASQPNADDNISTTTMSCPDGTMLLETCVLKTLYAATDSISLEAVLAKHTSNPYWIIPSRYGAGVQGDFILRVFSAGNFVLSRECLDDHWRQVTVDVPIVSSGEFMCGEDNAQVAVHVSPMQDTACTSANAIVTSSSCSRASDGISPGHTVVRATLVADEAGEERAMVAYTTGKRSSMEDVALALVLVKGELNAQREYVRTMGACDSEDTIAKTPLVAGRRVYTEVSAYPDEVFNMIGFVHPIGGRGIMQFNVWTSLSSVRASVLPSWVKEVRSVAWTGSGSGISFESTGNPQLEVHQVPRFGRFVVRMDMTSYSCTEPVIMISVISNHERRGEGILGSIPTDRIIARSQYTRDHWVQCEVELTGELLDSILVIPTLQPPGSTGTCDITVHLESPECLVRTLCGGVGQSC